MFVRKLARSLALLVWLPIVVTTCGGASFQDPSKITGLRVLAVQKSAPYPKPGEQVDLKLVYWDAKSMEDNPRDLFVMIAKAPCEDPLGDLYFNCLAQLGGATTDDGGSGDMPDGGDAGDATDAGPGGDMPDASAARADLRSAMTSRAGSALTSSSARVSTPAASGGPSSVGFVPLAEGDYARLRNISASDFVRVRRAEAPLAASRAHDINHVVEGSVRISSDIITRHPVSPGVQPYGLAYVLFIACAGMPRPVLNAGPNELPFGCFDADGRQLGADDFVIGYTSLYVYDNRVNHNPVIDDFLFDGASIASSTTDDGAAPHMPACKETDRSKCPKHVLKPAINREATVEIDDDPNAKTPDGKQLEEQAWVNYYITAGSLKSGVRLVNDATQGWNEKNEAEYTAPAESGPVRVFAVVHDNRGGIAWTEGKLFID